ncbi:MAG: hypothetical protein IJ306_09625 [Oscillospiraceae bacterium]|nr:hypothetical protein [Oscillospiraceae bacterium]
MLNIDVSVPCECSPGHNEVVRVYYDFDENGNFRFIYHNGCDFMSHCNECEKCFKSLYSIAEAASTYSDLLEHYPPAR